MFICVHLWFQTLLQATAKTRRGLAARAKMAASAGHDHAPDFPLATKTGLPIALVDTMPELEFSAIALGIDVV